jgi:hypothetical protein
MMDTTRCPLCGKPNRCAVAQGGDISACWCAAAIIDRETLAAIPVGPQQDACLCPACAQGDAPPPTPVIPIPFRNDDSRVR